MYFGRSLILYLVIVTLLYGTSEIWPKTAGVPATYKASGGGYGSVQTGDFRRGYRASYADIRKEAYNPVGEFQSAGGKVVRGAN